MRMNEDDDKEEAHDRGRTQADGDGYSRKARDRGMIQMDAGGGDTRGCFECRMSSAGRRVNTIL